MVNSTTTCAKKDTVKVTVNPLPTANAGIDKTIILGNSTVIGSTAIAGNTYTWTPSTALSSAFVATPTASSTSTTVYTVSVKTTATGCTKTDQMTLTVTPNNPNAKSSIPDDNMLKEVIAYPNPVGELLTLSSIHTLDKDIDIQLLNTMGEMILTEKIRPNSHPLHHEISTEMLTKGVYILRLHTQDGQQHVLRIVKE
jgi:hypothetical protein